jgi:hypothetical protein
MRIIASDGYNASAYIKKALLPDSTITPEENTQTNAPQVRKRYLWGIEI